MSRRSDRPRDRRRRHVEQLAKVGASASIAGGAMWIVKGVAILAVGDQPALLFEGAGLLFPVALMGLYGLLDGAGGRPARIGGTLAWVGGVSALLAAAYGVLVSDPSDVVLGVAIATCALATVAGLILLGVAVRAGEALPRTWRNLPFAMGVAAIPALTIVGGILAAIQERLLELPVVAYGVAWVVLGAVVWSVAAARRPPIAV